MLGLVGEPDLRDFLHQFSLCGSSGPVDLGEIDAVLPVVT
jgi:hypothetical protein